MFAFFSCFCDPARAPGSSPYYYATLLRSILELIFTAVVGPRLNVRAARVPPVQLTAVVGPRLNVRVVRVSSVHLTAVVGYAEGGAWAVRSPHARGSSGAARMARFLGSELSRFDVDDLEKAGKPLRRLRPEETRPERAKDSEGKKLPPGHFHGAFTGCRLAFSTKSFRSGFRQWIHRKETVGWKSGLRGAICGPSGIRLMGSSLARSSKLPDTSSLRATLFALP